MAKEREIRVAEFDRIEKDKQREYELAKKETELKGGYLFCPFYTNFAEIFF